jgi:hypothetical protein
MALSNVYYVERTHIETPTACGRFSLSAVLMESVRVDGKQRLKVVKHLATIKERRIVWDSGRSAFRYTVKYGLDELEKKRQIDRAQIEAAISARVRKWTEAEERAFVIRLNERGAHASPLKR